MPASDTQICAKKFVRARILLCFVDGVGDTTQSHSRTVLLALDGDENVVDESTKDS